MFESVSAAAQQLVVQLWSDGTATRQILERKTATILNES